MNNRELQIIGISLFAIMMIAKSIPVKESVMPTVRVSTDLSFSNNEQICKAHKIDANEDIDEELYSDSLELLACCVQAEAGNQSNLGKQLVVDVVLNRVDSPNFPNTIGEVIEQSGQFAVVGNDLINMVEPSQRTWDAVMSEIDSRVNKDVLYFRTGRYADYGTPWEKVGDHYFSTK